MSGSKRVAKAPLPTEHAIQKSFVQWVNLSKAQYPELHLGFAVPNAAKRGFALAARMKAEGMEPGIPDWLLIVPRGGYSGLAIEFKSAKGKLSEAQFDKIHRMEKEGWLVHVLRDSEQAIQAVKEYLKK